MNRSKTVFVSLFGLAVLACGLFLVFNRTSGAVPDDEPPEVVYVDTKTGATFLIASKTSPDSNPETGEKTLVPGLYCSECQAWKAVGPVENRQLRRKTNNCPIHKIPLTNDGPDPD